MAEDPQITEGRLDALREESARTGKVQDQGIVPAGSPFPKPATAVSYHGNPVLKPPTWTWQVPLYFFVGGVAGISAVIALVAHLFGNADLIRAGLWIGFLGALISAPLLIADLGRPARFLNMLRVFKLRSAMSVGAWTLSGFSAAVGLAVVCHELVLAGHGNDFLLVLEWIAEISGALSGLILASYTSVLLGVTAIPVWSENRKLVPVVFLAGGLGSAAAVLELLGFLVPVTQFIGIVAGTVETVVAILIELRGRYVDRPLREGAVGWLTRTGALLAGPTSLLLRIFWGHSSMARYLAALCFLIGALISRYAWIGAGRVSSRDPQALFRIQRPALMQRLVKLYRESTPSAPLRSDALIVRLTAISVALAGIAGLFMYAGGWLTPRTLSPASMINTFEQVNGSHPGFRRNHAKGVCVTGYFESNGHAQVLSKASVFLPGRVPIIGRFALAGGQPYVSDAPHTVRSMAILFKLPNGEEWRTGMNNIPVFAVNTAQGFHDQLLASALDPATGKPDPASMNAFLAKHPESARAIELIRSHPVSSGFANSTYNSLNAFRFIALNGAVVPVRWSMAPAQPFEPLDSANPGQAGKNYLFDALIAGIHANPLQWHLVITVGQPGDPTADATLPWPPDRQQIDAGTLTIDHVESEDTSPARGINFDPLVLPNGIAASDDPLLSARSAAYSQSFTRREGEHKDPSAVSAAETGK